MPGIESLPTHEKSFDRSNNNDELLINKAVQMNQEERVKVLIEQKADVNYIDDEGLSLLHHATLNGNVGILTYLIAANANVDVVPEESGETPLFCAVRRSEIDCMRELLKAKANPNATEQYGQTLLDHAIFHGDTECVKFLVEANAQVEGQGYLLEVCNRGRTDCINILLDAKADINIADRHGATPIYRATEHGHVDCLKTLITAKANVDTKMTTRMPFSTVGIAAFIGNETCLKVLLEAKANFCIGNLMGTTAMHLAARTGQTGIIKILLDAKADINVKDNYDNTPLIEALLEDQIAVINQIAEEIGMSPYEMQRLLENKSTYQANEEEDMEYSMRHRGEPTCSFSTYDDTSFPTDRCRRC